MVALSPRTVVRGNPPHPDHQIDPLELVTLLEAMQLQGMLAGPLYFEDTLAGLKAVSPDAGATGFVIDNGANNGVYRYSGGAWQKTSVLPSGFTLEAFDDAIAALRSDLHDRRVVAVGASDFSEMTFPERCYTVLQRETADVSIWTSRIKEPPQNTFKQQDRDGRWWQRLWSREEALQNAGKIFATRQDAVDAGQDALPAQISRIITLEGGAVVIRGTGSTSDALFDTYPSWGVVQSIDVPALAARVATLEFGTVYFQPSPKVTGKTIRAGAALVITLNGDLWTDAAAPSGGAETDDLQKDARGQWWARVVAAAAHTHTAAQIRDAGATGRSVLTSATMPDARRALGLGSAATAQASEFATAAQGRKADAALQPGDLDQERDRAIGAERELATRERARAETRRFFSDVLTGENRPEIAGGTLVPTSRLGVVLRAKGAETVGGSQDIATRTAYAIEPDRVYEIRVRLRRHVDPADPQGHGIELRMQNLDHNRAHVSNVALTALPDTVADGVTEYVIRASRAGGAGYTFPTSALYAVPHLRLYGGDHETDIAVIDWRDVTDAAQLEDAVAGLDETAGGLQQGRVYFQATLKVSGKTIPASATCVITTNGDTWYKASAPGNGSETENLQEDASGQWWARVASREVREEADRAKAAEGLLAPENSPTFTGRPLAPTATQGTNTDQLATTAFVKAAISALVGGAPDALNTLNELADALNDDASFAATVTNEIARLSDGDVYFQTTPKVTGKTIREGAAFVVTSNGDNWYPRAAPNDGVETDDVQKTSDGRWWQRGVTRALEEVRASLAAHDGKQVQAIEAGAVIPMGLSSIDGASYVATLDPAFTNLGAATLPDGAQARFLIQTTNTVANPSVTINGTTFALRGADGETWPAGAFMRYRQYTVQRRGSTLRVVGGEVTMYDVKAATETGKLLNLVPVPGGGPLEFTVESGFDDTGVVPRAMLRFFPQDDVAEENPAFTINGVARQARDRDGGTLRADVLVKGTTYLAQISRGGSFVEIWPETSFAGQADIGKAIDDLTAHRTQTDAAVSNLTGTQAALSTDVVDASAAVSREAAARASLIQRSGGENLFSFTDRNGDAVWGTVREADGQWPDWAVGELDTRLGVSDQGAKISAVTDLIRPSQGRDLVSVMDRNGDAVWGTVREADGQWPDWAVAELAERLGLRSSAVGGQDFHLKDGRYWPANCDMTRVLTIGSSTPWDMRDNINAMLATLETRAGQEITQTNLSQRGEWSTHTAARFGVIPAKLTVTGNEIPASGPVDCVSSNINEDRQRLRSYTGWLAGVYGTLASPDYTLRFTRAEAGDPVAVPPDSAFMPEVGPTFRDAVLFLSTGKNDITSGETAEVVEARVAQIVDYLGPLNARFLVFGDWTNTGTGADAAYRVQIDAVNRLRKARYGPLYVPIRDYITSDQVWRDARDLDPAFAGPTPEDYAEQALGNKPPSLSLDGGHLNDFGRRLVLTYLVKPQLIGLGWYKQKETT